MKRTRLSETRASNRSAGIAPLLCAAMMLCGVCFSTAAQVSESGRATQALAARPEPRGAQRPATPAREEQSPTQKYFTDVVLVNQDG